ncbi:Cytochrome b5 isoform A-like protein [Drosera capensis]
MPTLTKLYSMKEVSEHNSKRDCWVVIDGKVYDVSTYLNEHPGGDDVVLEVTGKDSIEEFEDAGHSEEARELLETFFIGELDPSATTIPEASSREDTVAKPKEWPLQYWAIPVAVVGISMVVGFLYLRKR